ncbi:hypothetical protein EBQ26_00805 [Allofranklinella schreckenbergeri]|uniref:Uncharacterized protein n=1 Tax=Allofranklinella schreckenbergeri TaxID=1076744 RepID=A0A3M6QE07_9BURK|nr:hypothetical protein EBQ26_00805 [Allofranklinella schreckenbergeri]
MNFAPPEKTPSRARGDLPTFAVQKAVDKGLVALGWPYERSWRAAFLGRACASAACLGQPWAP